MQMPLQPSKLAVIFCFYAIAIMSCALLAAQHTDIPKQDGGLEVVSLHPLAPGPSSQAVGFTLNPTLDGYIGAMNVHQMIMVAYAPEDFYLWMTGHGTTTLRNQPAWANDWFVINARVSEEDRTAWKNQSSHEELLRSAFRSLLRDRFGLVIHEETTAVPNYKLMLVKKGAKLTASKPGADHTEQGFALPSGTKMVAKRSGRTEIDRYYGATTGDLAFLISRTAGRSVEDQTHLTGRYDFTVQQIERPSNPDDPVDDGPLRSLGLELKSGKGQGVGLVIDHINKPTPN